MARYIKSIEYLEQTFLTSFETHIVMEMDPFYIHQNIQTF